MKPYYGIFSIMSLVWRVCSTVLTVMETLAKNISMPNHYICMCGYVVFSITFYLHL